MDNAFIRRLINFITNKEQVGNTLSPDEFNDLLQKHNFEHFKRKVNMPEEYKPGQPFPSQGYEITQKITDDISPFKVVTDISVASATGYATTPADYYTLGYLHYKYPTSVDCEIITSPKPIGIVTDAQWSYRLENPITKPTKKHPVANFQAGFIRIMPKDLYSVEICYLRYPHTPIYDYYLDQYAIDHYLEPGTSYTLQAGEEGSAGQTAGTVTSNSVELEWNDVNKLDITSLMLESIGINLREQQLLTYSQLADKDA